jgi:hypothetical protein
MCTFIVIALIAGGVYVFIQSRKSKRSMSDQAAVTKLDALEKVKALLKSEKSGGK